MNKRTLFNKQENLLSKTKGKRERWGSGNNQIITFQNILPKASAFVFISLSFPGEDNQRNIQRRESVLGLNIRRAKNCRELK